MKIWWDCAQLISPTHLLRDADLIAWQTISVKRDNMVATTSHHERSVDKIHNTNKLVPGAKVILDGLMPYTLKYKDESWPDQSKLNGSIGYILRRESNLWIVELESDSTVGSVT